MEGASPTRTGTRRSTAGDSRIRNVEEESKDVSEDNKNVYLKLISLCKKCRHLGKHEGEAACLNPKPLFNFNYETGKCEGFEPSK